MDKAFSKAIIEQVWSARQASTVNKYCYSLRKYFAFLCMFNGDIALPISAIEAAKYIAYLRVNSAAHSAFKIILCAMKWINNFFPGISQNNCPLSDNFLTLLKDSALRDIQANKNQKEIISGDSISRISGLLPDKPTPIQFRNILMPVLGYALLLRHDELSHLNCMYMSESLDGVTILIPSSKTDVYRNGKKVMLARSENKRSAFQLLKHYLDLINLEMGFNHFLFTPLVGNIPVNQKLSYGVFRDNIKNLMSTLGFDPQFFATHSVRSGAATSLASKVTEFELLIIGRWRDRRSLNSYVKVSDQRRFEISRELSL